MQEKVDSFSKKISAKVAIKNLLKEDLYNSTAQAIFKIYHTPHLSIKVFLFVCVLASSGISSYLLVKSVLIYLSYEVNTITRQVFEMPSIFPRVTICNYNQFTTEHAIGFLKITNMDISPNISIFDADQMKTLNHSQIDSLISDINKRASAKMFAKSFPLEEKLKQSHFIDDLLLNCNFNKQPCTSADFVWTLDPLMGNCYAFNTANVGTTLKKTAIAGPVAGLQMDLYVNFHENLTLFNSFTGGIGAIIHIDNNSYMTDYISEGIYVMPGTITSIAVDRKFMVSLSKPYSNCEISNEKSPQIQSDLYKMISNSAYEYSQQFCFKQCIQQQIFNACNCTYPFYVSLFGYAECSDEKSLKCSSDVSEKLIPDKYVQALCEALCPLECNLTEYEASVTSLQLIGDYYVDLLKEKPNLVNDFVDRSINATTARDSVVRVNIFYESLSYSMSTEIPKMDFVSLFSNIGGTLSLFLGVSVFSVFEIVEVLMEIYFEEKIILCS